MKHDWCWQRALKKEMNYEMRKFTFCQHYRMKMRGRKCLKRRRELLDEGVPKEKIKIRNFELFNDGKKEMIEAEQADDA